MSGPTHQPPEDRRRPEGSARPPVGHSERLRERIAAARASVEASLREVLAELEREEAALGGDVEEEGFDSPLDERIEAASRRAVAERAHELASRFEDQVEHVDRALVLIAASERRMIDLSDRLEGAGRTVVRALNLAAEIVDWEQRVGSAITVEREVADRIAAAERRLRDLAEPEP